MEEKGVNVRPQYVAETQAIIAYGREMRLYISPREAPPDARQGDPMKPCEKRRTIRPGKFPTSAVGIEMITKRNIVLM